MPGQLALGREHDTNDVVIEARAPQRTTNCPPGDDGSGIVGGFSLQWSAAVQPAAQAVRSARKAEAFVTVRLDPVEIA